MDLEQWPGMSDQGRLATQRTPGDLGTDGASVLVIDDDPGSTACCARGSKRAATS